MKKILSIAALSMLSLSSLLTTPAQAVGTSTATGNFDVTVNLTANCKFDATSTAIDFGTYDAFNGPSITAPSTNISFKCTNGLAPSSVAVDAVNTVVNGLAYTLAVTGGTASGGSAGTSTTAAVADTRTYTVTGTMATGQAGTGSGTATVARVLTVTY
ncbi:MAG: hypothetical protein JJD98_08405 [Polaromonas sp.]|nr:hypothetical protein [Polaromonas sp.]